MIQTLFGTDGIRARVGTSPFVPAHLIRLGHALAKWMIETYGQHTHYIIGSDSRLSSDWIKATLHSSLLQYPLHVHDVGILPTPGFLQYVLREPPINAGIIISASHNPHHDNGIKIVDKNGKLSAAAEQRIMQLYTHAHEETALADFGTYCFSNHAGEQYTATLIDQAAKLSLASKKIVIDCAHGATSFIAPTVFAHTQAQIITLNNTPTGTNINHHAGAVHPEAVRTAVLAKHADIGFAFDGDGDRIIVVTADGTIKDGDDIIALLAAHPRYASLPALVGTIMSNQGLAAWLSTHNKTLIRTDVGDKYITHALKESALLLGGEPSGHIIMHDYLPISDGIATALRILETISITDNWCMETFTKFPQILTSIPVKEKKNLQQDPLHRLIEQSKAQLIQGRLIVRYSGTESLLRIMAEGENFEQTQHVVHYLSEQLYKALN